MTVKPEKPEIEKYVNEAVHKYINIDETFKYDVLAYVTEDADAITITDELDKQLQLVQDDEHPITVKNVGDTDNHKPTNDIYNNKIADDATVAEAGVDVEGAVVKYDEETRTLTVDIEDATAVRGKWVKVTFYARINEELKVADLEYTEVPADEEFIPEGEESRTTPNVGNDPVKSDEPHDGVPNTASYKIKVGNKYK